MTKSYLEDEELKILGTRAVETVVTRAVQMAEAGVDRALVAAWMEGAAEAFNHEMDLAVSLLKTRATSSSRH